jgi:hypothetical protein
MRVPAKPRVKDYREISPEADALRRQLLVELKVSANQLAEMAIQALAAAHKRGRAESVA